MRVLCRFYRCLLRLETEKDAGMLAELDSAGVMTAELVILLLSFEQKRF